MLLFYHDKCKVMYADTNSLIYYIKCINIYNIMKRDIDWFDLAITQSTMHGIPLANKKISGLMKDENNSAIMIKFFRLK